jgi:hypothetical protein
MVASILQLATTMKMLCVTMVRAPTQVATTKLHAITTPTQRATMGRASSLSIAQVSAVVVLLKINVAIATMPMLQMKLFRKSSRLQVANKPSSYLTV